MSENKRNWLNMTKMKEKHTKPSAMTENVAGPLYDFGPHFKKGDWPTERKPSNDGHILHFASILFSFLKSDRHSKFRQSSSGSQDIEYRWAKLIYGPICILTWLCLHRNSCHTWVAGMTYLKRPGLEVPLHASWVVKPISKPWSQKAKR